MVSAAPHGLKRVLVKMTLIVRMLKGVKTKLLELQELLQLEHVRVSPVQLMPIADSTKSVILIITKMIQNK